MLFRVLITECLKIKRTLALWTVVLAPLVVVLLQFLIGFFGAERLAKSGRDHWPILVQQTVIMWTVLMLPLFLTLETSLLAGLEHVEKNWKSLLALPAPRWTIYLSKLIVTIAMVWTAHVVLVTGTLLSGKLLNTLRPALPLNVAAWTPLISPMLRVSAACLLAVAIQHWVSLRWQSFTAAMGFGMSVMIVGFAAVNSAEWGPRVPWSMPMYALRGSDPVVRTYVMAAALAGAAVVAAIGCWEFSRRDIV